MKKATILLVLVLLAMMHYCILNAALLTALSIESM